MSNQLSPEMEFDLERYELREGSAYRFDLTRRDLFKAFGCGLLVLYVLDSADAQESGGGRQRRGGGGGPQDIGAYVHVGEDGKVTAFSGKVEVGQGARAELSQVVAEELRVPLSSVTMVLADTDLTPYDAGTFGSQTTPGMVPRLRRAAAAAREALVDLAAEKLKADRSTLQAVDGHISNSQSHISVAYGELTKGQKLTRTISADAPITAPDKWAVCGKLAHRPNGADIVTGKHKFTPDIKRPNMLRGKVLRPTSFGAELGSFDGKAAEAMAGVTVVRDGNFVGVVGPSEQAATRALDAIKAEWKTSPQPSGRELFEILKKGSGETGGFEGRGGGSQGSLEQGLASADKKLQQTYTIAYIAHAPMEPRAAVAEWNEDKLTVWTGTQRPFGVRSELASAFRIPEERVHVITPDTGAGYGGKHTGESAIEAARLAKACGKPVKLVWTREEEFTWAYFRPAGVIEVSSGAKSDGTLVAWDFHNYNSGGSAIRTPYAVANQRTQFHNAKSPLRQGSYRALASTANNFARETHMDEMAHEVGHDPLAFRLKNLTDDRMRAVLEAAATKFGWDKSKLAAGRGYGISCGTEKGGYVAACAEVQAVKGQPVKVIRVVTAFECGAIINPDNLKNQVEGATIMGIGGALFEAIQFDNGKILNPRFSKYRVPRFEDVPKLETLLLDRKDLASAGAGESPIICVAPAIGNAIFSATGMRLRAMPLSPGPIA
jgi:nicotinate dehydrogenase subunit B